MRQRAAASFIPARLLAGVMALDEKLGIGATIAFTLTTLLGATLIAYGVSFAFYALIGSGSELQPLAPGFLDVSPKLRTWAAVLAVQYGPVQTEAGLLAALELLVLIALAIGAAAGAVLGTLLRPLSGLPGVDLSRAYELWQRRIERRWFAVLVLALVILFEILRVPGYVVTPQEAVPYFDLQDMWFDMVPLVFAGFLLTQVGLIRRRAARADRNAQ